MKYTILESDDKDDLEKTVKNKLENSWILAGGLVIVLLPNGIVRYYQSMYKDE